ncbi:MAG: hypothetical protein F4018_19820 [Acidobacteria bacterium]|nr:hypothetical protein [Acidobacteriota bacterium]MYK90406.1 hypothetical protein [Acidobacteriota bacterium]
MSIEEWQALRASFKERDRDAEPPMLVPAEAFDDTRPDEEFRERFHPDHDPGQLGRHSRAVRRRLGSSCAGWRRKPRPEEFYDAVRASRPSPRERQLIRTWLQEASREDFLYAWAEGVYTWRELARAVHAAGEQTSPRCADINTLIPS